MNKKSVAVLLFLPTLAWANVEVSSSASNVAEHRAQVYHTPRERREAGLGTKLTDRLTLSGLARFEIASFDNNFRNQSPNAGRDEALSAVQLGFKLEMSEQVESEIILDFDDSKTDSALDEAFIEIKSGRWGLSAGTQTLPFGAYYSHFISGPLLEFGETRKTALLVGYDYNDVVEFSVFAYKGDARKRFTDDRLRDWAAAVEAKFLGNRLRFGASYIADLADSDAHLLKDFDNQYRRRVSAWSAYAVVRTGIGEISIEALQAISKFHELAPSVDRPRAWNFEIAAYPTQTWQIAARVERSDELSNQPERRYGIAATWLVFEAVTMTIEALRSDYKRGFVFDDNGNEIQRQTHFAIELLLEF